MFYLWIFQFFKFILTNFLTLLSTHFSSSSMDLKFSNRMVFGVADSESELKIQKFKMLDPIWLTKMQKFTWLGRKFVFGVFRLRWYDYEFELNIMTDQNAKCKKFTRQMCRRKFFGSLIMNLMTLNLEIQYRGSKMAAINLINYPAIMLEICI